MTKQATLDPTLPGDPRLRFWTPNPNPSGGLGSRLNSMALAFEFVLLSSSVSLLTFPERDPPSNLPLYLSRDQNSLRGAPKTIHVRPLLVTPDADSAAIFGKKRFASALPSGGSDAPRPASHL